MATDEELLIINTLTNGWLIANAAVPNFYYNDTIQQHDFRNFDAIKVYVVSRNETPKGLGYLAYESQVRMTIDIRSSDRSRMMKDRDEVARIIRANRKTLSGFDIFKITSERKQASYLNYYQYIFEVYLHRYRTAI